MNAKRDRLWSRRWKGYFNANLNDNYNEMEDNKPKKARNFRNYKVWQDAVAYATKVCKVTSGMSWAQSVPI